MREILFRAWDDVKDRMYHAGEEDDVVFELTGVGIKATAITEEEEEFQTLHHLKYMQYTGLKDKNGKEIYEGHVLETRHMEVGRTFIGRVTFSYGRFAVVYPGCYRQDMGESVWDCTVMGTEIIGNIYENADQFPHLLEGRDEA
ncbi:hypothetical protein BK124_11465 [Paenibacillus amylolyticus]|uniref:YopX family protein n=1 Tax=Paenibacillus amylolyticus TaxID=1451 RepID=UPI00096CB401|nr:YopX family protein [Paenibacillus amylolyticus]OMF00270.1 hypothetical protein BK124_11465 [Paenibacillus amylolyticus]